MRFLLTLIFLASCSNAPVELSPEAQNIEVLTSKPQGCKTVGKVVGKDENGSMEMALTRALMEAEKLGATSLFVNQEVPNGKEMSVHATSYKCD